MGGSHQGKIWTWRNGVQPTALDASFTKTYEAVWLR